MKLLFSSSDLPEVALVNRVLVRAGIQCKLVHENTVPTPSELPAYPELWVDEDDFLAASMLFASQRRPSPSVFQ